MNEIKTVNDLKKYAAKYGYFSHGRYCMILDGKEYDIEAVFKMLALMNIA